MLLLVGCSALPVSWLYHIDYALFVWHTCSPDLPDLLPCVITMRFVFCVQSPYVRLLCTSWPGFCTGGLLTVFDYLISLLFFAVRSPLRIKCSNVPVPVVLFGIWLMCAVMCRHAGKGRRTEWQCRPSRHDSLSYFSYGKQPHRTSCRVVISVVRKNILVRQSRSNTDV